MHEAVIVGRDNARLGAPEEVRVRLPETEWAAGFLHERTLRPRLDKVVREAGLWVA